MSDQFICKICGKKKSKHGTVCKSCLFLSRDTFLDARNLELTPTLSAVVGHLMADGCVTSRGIFYSNQNKKLCIRFADLITTLLNGKVHIGHSTQIRSNREKLFGIQVHRKLLAYSLVKRFGSFYCHKWIIPNEIKTGSKPIRMEFVKSFILDEGSVTSRNSIMVSSRNPNIFEIVSIMHDFNGITTHTNKSGLSYYLYIKRIFPENNIDDMNLTQYGKYGYPPFWTAVRPNALTSNEINQLKIKKRYREYLNLYNATKSRFGSTPSADPLWFKQIQEKTLIRVNRWNKQRIKS